MDIQSLQEGDKVQYVDKYGVARNGTVLRNRTTETATPRLFLTVQDVHERVEVIRDPKKVISIS